MEKKFAVLGVVIISLLVVAVGYPILEIGFLISLASAVLAVVLFAVSTVAYKRERRSRLLFVMAAFLLFATKNLFSAAHEMFEFVSGNSPLQIFSLEHMALLLDFFILLVLFVGLVKK